jgi:integration host factor subunit beta
MNKSELIEQMAARFPHLPPKTVDAAIRILIHQMAEGIAAGERIEIRRFGSFTKQIRKPRLGRNPKTGQPIEIPETSIARFRPGKKFCDFLNSGKEISPE